jgi:heptosyltransferase-1
MAERVLIVRLSAIGDVVMALPAAASIKASNPGAQVAWVIDHRLRELVVGHPYIDRVYGLFTDRGTRRNPTRWRVMLRQHRRIAEFCADVGIDLHGHAKSALPMYFSKAKQKLTLEPKDALSRLLGGRAIRVPATMHRVDAYLEAVREAGFPFRRYSFDLPINDAIRGSIHRWLGEGGWITVHVGGTHAKKIWPLDRFVAVGKHLVERGERLVLVGGTTEREIADMFLRQVEAVDAVGKTGLLELAEVIRRARLHLSGDTGSAHIAAAVGTTCVTIFGHMPAAVYHPFGQPEAVVQVGRSAADVPVEMVLRRIEERLK